MSILAGIKNAWAVFAKARKERKEREDREKIYEDASCYCDSAKSNHTRYTDFTDDWAAGVSPYHRTYSGHRAFSGRLLDE